MSHVPPSSLDARVIDIIEQVIGACAAAPAPHSMPRINRIDHMRLVVKDREPVKTVWAAPLGKTAADETYVDEPEKRPFRECELAFVHPRATPGVLLECIDDMAGAGEAS